MLKKVLEYLPITTIFVAYLYLCGGLYLVAYWSVFDIDIFSLVSLSEIPKSFIFPFIVSQGFFLLQSLTDYSVKYTYFDIQSNSTWWHFLRQPNTYLLLSLFASCWLFFFPQTLMIWYITGGLLGFGGILRFIGDSYINTIVKDFHLRKYLAILIVMTPITCFILGKVKSIQVRKNITIKYISIINTTKNPEMLLNADKIRYKLLGFLGEKAIVSTLGNEKVYILNQSAIDVIEIEEPTEEK